jgi:DNA-binding CsgD family transcriptional regulator
MSNVKTSPNGDYERCSPPTSPIPTRLNAGWSRTRSGSNFPCFTSPCDEMRKNSGTSMNHRPKEETELAEPDLAQVVRRHGYGLRIGALAERIAQATDPSAVLTLLRTSTRALGAQSAAFVTFVRDKAAVSSCRFLLACEPGWSQRYLEEGCIEHDPWLAYAARYSAPVQASRLAVAAPEAQGVVQLAAEYGFASVALVPVHSGEGQPRVSLLCLGSSRRGYFEGEGFGRFRLGARLIAAELHDWSLARLRNELLDRARITAAEIGLLHHEHLGHSSKRIAAELRTSASAINSRFQRMNSKLGVSNRRMAASLALECGLFLD